jgi:hypothetical protein
VSSPATDSAASQVVRVLLLVLFLLGGKHKHDSTGDECLDLPREARGGSNERPR